MVVRRARDLIHLPPPHYKTDSRQLTLTFLVKRNCGLDEIGQEVIKSDNVAAEEIRTVAHLNQFADLAQLIGSRKYYMRKDMDWQLITCDWHVFQFVQSNIVWNEVTFSVQIMVEEVGNNVDLGNYVEETLKLVENEVRSLHDIPSELHDVNLWVSDCEDSDYTSHDVYVDTLGEFGTAIIQDEPNRVERVGDDQIGSSRGQQSVKCGVVDRRVVFGKGKVTRDNFGGFESEESESDENFGLGSDDDMDSDLESDEEDTEMPTNRPKKKYVKKSEFYDPQLTVGIRFPDKPTFRIVCTNHAVAHQRNISFVRNDKEYIFAKCDIHCCPWFVHARLIDSEKTWCIYKLNTEHTCGPCYNVHNVKSTWLAERYLGKFKVDPDRSIESIRDDVFQDLGIRISKDQAYRTKRKACDMIMGDPDEQFTLLWDYGQELMRSNEGSTVLVDYDKETKKFTNFYSCFGALKQAFISACRPILGVDGAHLKGPHKGVLLTACVVDPNDKPLPLAWAVVNTENGDTWAWFLRVLKKDLQINKPEDFTFISDKQKGLLNAFKEVFPESRHRFCVMHLWRNMYKAGFRGDAYRSALLKASNATTIGKFNTAMEELGQLDDKVLAWLHDKHPTQWSKSHFHTLPKCDSTLNNGCENYNKCILLAR